MVRLFAAVGKVFSLPPVWIAFGVTIWALIITKGWQPFVDIILYAIQRLAQ